MVTYITSTLHVPKKHLECSSKVMNYHSPFYPCKGWIENTRKTHCCIKDTTRKDATTSLGYTVDQVHPATPVALCLRLPSITCAAKQTHKQCFQPLCQA